MAISRRTKRATLGFLAIGAAVTVVLFTTDRFLEAQREKQRYEQERKELRPPDPVAVRIDKRALRRERKFGADVEPWVSAGVPSEVPGRVAATKVEPGQAVKAGDILVELDDRRALIAVDLARARHREALRLLDEANRLKSSRVVSQTAYEAAVAEARVTKAQLDDAEDMLARHRITAPFDGFVNERMVDAGDAVSANQPAVRVVDISKLRVVFDVSANDLAAFTPGKKVVLRVEGGAKFDPEIQFVARAADPSTRLFRVEAELPNPDNRLPGGMQGMVEANVEAFPEGPVVPAAAVRFVGREARVLKQSGGGPVETPVVLGPEIDGVYPVLDGLAEGDRVFLR